MIFIDLMGCREGIVCCTVRAPRALIGGLLNLVIRELGPVVCRPFIVYVLVGIATLFEDDDKSKNNHHLFGFICEIGSAQRHLSKTLQAR